MLNDLTAVPCALALMLLAAGCGESSVELEDAGGVVTYNGSPLPGATVMFIPEKGPIASGVTDLEGRFDLSTGALSGAVVGKHRVAVTATKGDSSQQTPSVAPEREADAAAKMMKAFAESQKTAKDSRPKWLIPEKYGKPETSGLAYAVEKGGTNHFEIDLTN